MAALLLLHASLIDRWAVRPSPVVAARSLAPAQMQATDSFPSRKVVRNQLTPAQVDALRTRAVELEARIDNLEGGANAGAVVGSACCQVWEGPGSNNASWQKLIKIGVVWNLYVAPEYRERGVEAKLLERVVGRQASPGSQASPRRGALRSTAHTPQG